MKLVIAILILLAAFIVMIALSLFLFWFWHYLLEAIKSFFNTVLYYPDSDETHEL
jgi:ABC-type antimicrobial peptide transport system permease subunit